MDPENPFDAINRLEPIAARPMKGPKTEKSFVEVVQELHNWLPSEIIGALQVSKEAGHDVDNMARSLSQIVTTLRGERKSNLAIRRWFSSAQLKMPDGQLIYLSTVVKTAGDLIMISKRLQELGELRREKTEDFGTQKGKRQERVAAALDRVDERAVSLTLRRDSRARDFEQLLKMVADYITVGRGI